MKTIAIDFDGVIHSYTSGWQGAGKCDDPPVPGAADFIRSAMKRFRVCVYSTRAESPEGRSAILAYLLLRVGLTMAEAHEVTITAGKPKALVYIDDRAWRFEGAWPNVDAVAALRPWNKEAP